jgi:Sec-independent protein secretion pathway component TatC
VSMILIMIPLIALYEASILLARRFGRPSSDRVGTEVSPGEAG